MASRSVAATIAGIFVVDAEIHFVVVDVVVQDDLFQTVVEIVLHVDVPPLRFATRAARSAATTSRFALLARATRFAWLARGGIGILQNFVARFRLVLGARFIARLALGAASATSAAATPTASATRLATFVGGLAGAIFATARIR
jgi:hypothetical protein